MPLPIPESMADVTPEWVEHALTAGGHLRSIESVRVEPLPEDQGLIGDLALVRVTYADAATEPSADTDADDPEQFVLKLPAANPDSRRIGSMLNAYGRESAFYASVATPEGAHLARCFTNEHDATHDRWALVIEFIEADPSNGEAGATESQANAAIDALAALHGDWWGGATEFEWMPGFDRAGVGGLAAMWQQNLPTFIDRYAHVLPAESTGWVLDFAPRLAQWSDEAAQQPLTLVHADYRLDNLVFRNDQVTIIDWQTAMRAPAAMDLSCFIATSLTVEQRRQHEERLIDRYLLAVDASARAIDPTWFRRSYDENLLWWMGQFGNNLAHLSPTDPGVQAALTTMAERVYTAGFDRNVGRLL